MFPLYTRITGTVFYHKQKAIELRNSYVIYNLLVHT